MAGRGKEAEERDRSEGKGGRQRGEEEKEEGKEGEGSNSLLFLFPPTSLFILGRVLRDGKLRGERERKKMDLEGEETGKEKV